MTTLETFKNSNAWVSEYNLPLVGQHNNPFIYCAYALKLIKLNSEKDFQSMLLYFYLYLSACKKSRGLYYRWPDHSGGAFSYDEMIGIGSISSIGAFDIYAYLVNHWGVYDNGELPDKKWRFFRFNQYRFPFLIPYLKASSGIKLNWLDKIFLNGFLKSDICRYDSGDEGGRLRIWLMLDNISLYLPKDVKNWKDKMNAKGVSPKSCFQVYFPHHSAFWENAPASF